MGGAVKAVESGYMKERLVESNTKRLEAIERGEQVVVGVNKFTESEPSPLSTGAESILTVSHEVEDGQIERLKAWRESRDQLAVKKSLDVLSRAAKDGSNIMPPSIACAKAGVTTGEWGAALRQVFGEYRAPTGVGRAVRNDAQGLDEIREQVNAASRRLGRRVKFLVGKPGLDGHSNGAEQIAARARDAGMEVVYQGIRLTPDEIVNAARDEKVHVVGLSILSGSHVPLVREVLEKLRMEGLNLPVVVGGIIPPEDEALLKKSGVAAVFTPKDYELNRILGDLVKIVETSAGKNAA
jgi:(2R)-ethylmalonyl-CoA mutase